jgi:ABC-type Co2+ transport system permease subunit
LKNIPFSKFIPGIIWFFLVLILIALPQQNIPEVDDWYHQIYIDKWIHAGIFGVLAFLFMWPFLKSASDSNKKVFFIIALLASIWGYLTECIQIFVPGRSYDLLDWLADSTGVLIVLLFILRKISKPHSS